MEDEETSLLKAYRKAQSEVVKADNTYRHAMQRLETAKKKRDEARDAFERSVGSVDSDDE